MFCVHCLSLRPTFHYFQNHVGKTMTFLFALFEAARRVVKNFRHFCRSEGNSKGSSSVS